MDSLSSSDDIRYVTLRVSSEGAGRFIELDDQTGKNTLTFYSPDDLMRLAETARQMWAQGDVMAPNDDPICDQPPFVDSACIFIRRARWSILMPNSELRGALRLIVVLGDF